MHIDILAWLVSSFTINCPEPLQKPLVCQFRQACLPPSFQTKVRWEAKSMSVCRSGRELALSELAHFWRGWLTAAQWWSSDFWVVTCMHANYFFSTDFNEFSTSSVAQQLEFCGFGVFLSSHKKSLAYVCKCSTLFYIVYVNKNLSYLNPCLSTKYINAICK